MFKFLRQFLSKLWCSRSAAEKRLADLTKDGADFITQMAWPYAVMSCSGKKANLTDSKLGGVPYFPVNGEYPRVRHGLHEGKPLRLLVQINCEQAQFASPFPQKGILQFFILDVPNNALGMDMSMMPDCMQNQWRIVYYPELTEEQGKIPEEIAHQEVTESFPIREYRLLTVKQKSGNISTCDFRFKELVNEFLISRQVASPVLRYEVSQNLRAYFSKKEAEQKPEICCNGPYRCRYRDVREEYPHIQTHQTMLLQLEADDKVVRIFNRGIINFLINPEDLCSLTFTRVVYHWDCDE